MPDFSSHIIQEVNGPHFKCDKCGASTLLHNPSAIEIFACPSCRKIFSKSNYALYEKIPNQPTLKTRRDLPTLGSKGKLGDRTFVVIGIANKREKHNAYGVWKEIVLKDDLDNIHFLNCSYGNYTLVTRDDEVNAEAMLKSMVEKYEHNGLKFQFFSGYNYETTSFAGEFYYDVVDVRKTKCSDFLSPPHLISIEKDGEKIPVAYRGKHMYRKEVAEMFSNPAIADQNYEGIGMAQPFYGGLNVRRFNHLSLAFLTVIIIIGCLTGNPPQSGDILWFDKTLKTDASEIAFVTSPFRIYEHQSPAYLKISTSAVISDEWAETQITLVNENTGEEREYALGIEYYSGIDNGYSWSEGSPTGDINISEVGTGRYHLKGKILYSTISEDKSYRLTLGFGSTSGWNIGIIVFPYLGFLIIINILKKQFERMRTGEIDTLFGSSYTE